MAARLDTIASMMMSRPRRPAASQPTRRAPAAAREDASSRFPQRELSARGHRGEVKFFLQRIAGGLYVEREDIPRLGLRSNQSLQFADADGFRHWCDEDPIRFEHPTLHIDLKRQGDELWSVSVPTGDEFHDSSHGNDCAAI
jgi:hypothetical protein